VDPKEARDTGARALLVVASLVIVIAGMKAAASLILPFLVALFLAMITLPLLNWLTSKRIPKPLAVPATIIVALAVLVGIAAVIGGSIKGFTDQAPKYKQNLDQVVTGVQQWIETRGLALPDPLGQSVGNMLQPSQAFDMIAGTLKGAAGVLSNLFLVLLTIVFILSEAAGFPAKLQAAFGHRESSDRLSKIKNEVQRYLGIKSLISLTTGSIVAAALAIIGVDFPLLWGMLAFLLNYIPTFGSILAARAGGAARLRRGQRRAGQLRRALLHGPATRAVDSGRVSLVDLLGLGLGAGGHAALRAADDDRQDHAGEHGGSGLDRCVPRRGPQARYPAPIRLGRAERLVSFRDLDHGAEAVLQQRSQLSSGPFLAMDDIGAAR